MAITSPSTDGRDTRWIDHRSQRRELLLETALTVIDRDGPEASVAMIAAEAGIPRSVVYKLFKDREDLDQQIQQQIVNTLAAALAPALVPKGTTRDMVRGAVRRYVNWVRNNANLHRFLPAGSLALPSGSTGAAPNGKKIFAQNFRALLETQSRRVLNGKQPPRGMIDDLANGLIGLTDNTVNNWLLAEGNRSSVNNLVDFLTEAACGVIAATIRFNGAEVDLDAPVL